MSNQTGDNTLNFPPPGREDRTQFHLSNDCTSIEPRTGRVPVVKPYKVIYNATGMACELSGAKLINHIERLCGTLEIAAVLMRITFMPA